MASDRLSRLQLDLWRAACRHIDLGESVPDLATAIGAQVPIIAMYVFGLELDSCELIARFPRTSGAPAADITGDDADSLARFARKGAISPFHPARPARSLLRPLASMLSGPVVICGGLRLEGEAKGIVAWNLAPGTELDERTGTLLAATLEPIAVALDTSRRFHELEELRRAAEADRQSALRRLGRESLQDPIVGADGGLRAVMERVDLVARSDVPALILGETGSGKEVIARAIHDRSRRHDAPFLRVNCGAIPPELIDSQLFGHEKGAFTGATDRRQGWFERADRGTLFLDEVGELPPAAQVRLLRVLQDGSLERVGAHESIRVDCRIVAATHRDLADMVRQRTFREDLWYRLAVFPLVLPPLRDRRQDLPELVYHLARRASTRFGLPAFEIDDEQIAQLAEYAWPGNVRELAAVIDRAALLADGHRLAITAAMGLPTAAAGATRAPAKPQSAGSASLDQAIRTHIEATLRATRGKVEGPGGAAQLLDINPHTLRSKMRRLGVRWADYRNAAP